MAVVKLVEAHRIELETERVRGVLEVALLSGGIQTNDLLALLESRGLKYSNADLVSIRNALVADGTIEIV